MCTLIVSTGIAGLEVKNVCELYYQRETGLGIISSVIPEYLDW